MTRPSCLALLALAAPSCAPEPATSPPNVLLISIDTLRADRLGCYGYARDTTPALDRFATERAVRFETAVADSPWTLPSHVTMLTGLFPETHGATLPERAPTDEVTFLAEHLRRAGYYAFALTDGGWLSEPWGFDRGFDSFEAADTDFEATVEDAIAYLRHRDGKGPWFGFLHTYDVHCPYDPPEPWFSMFESPDAEPVEVAGRCGNPDFNELALSEAQMRYLSDRYDGGVRRADDALSKLFAFLDETDAWADTLVIVTSDHGEELGEHGRIGHERSLHREALLVPLLVASPGVPPRAVPGAVGLADLAPTILAACGLEPTDVDGVDLTPLLHGDARRQDSARHSHLAWKEALFSRFSANEHAILSDEGVRRYAPDDLLETRDLCEGADCDALARSLAAEQEERGARTRRTFVVRRLEGR